MRKRLLKPDNPLLRKISKDIDFKEKSLEEIKEMISELSKTLKDIEEGVALSACQIGLMFRIFIIKGKFFPEINNGQDQAFINPTIIKTSKKTKLCEEGCLSIPLNFGLVRRSDKVTIKAFDHLGQEKIWNSEGLLAQVFQHEIDHSNGILFIDRAKKIWQIDPEKIKNEEEN